MANQPYVVGLWGPEKTGKTTFLLSFPGVISIHDFDIGFYRAAYRFVPEGGQLVDDGPNWSPGYWEIRDRDGKLLVKCHSYPAPVNISIRNSPLKGYRELWTRFLTNLLADLADAAIKTIGIDTATQAWQICHMGFLQEKQEAQMPLGPNTKMRESLIPIEYAEPNSRMQAVEQAGKGYGKNLVIAHHQTAVYGKRMVGEKLEEYDTGEKQLDGFRRTGNLSDIIFRTSMDRRVDPASKAVTFIPKAEVVLCGLSLNMLGIIMENPTYQQMVNALSAFRN